VKIMPGVYDLAIGQWIQMKEYVDIEGSGRETTRIRHAAGGSLPAGVATGAAHSDLRNLTIEVSGSALTPVLNPSRMEDVTVIGPENNLCVWLANTPWDVVIRDAELTTAHVGLFVNGSLGRVSLEHLTISTNAIGLEVMGSGIVTAKDLRVSSNAEAALYLTGGDIVVEDAVVDSSGSWGGIYTASGTRLTLRNISLAFAAGYGIYAGSNSGLLEVADSELVAKTGGVPGMVVAQGQSARIRSVRINTAGVGQAPALQISDSATVQSFGGNYEGDVVIETPTGSLQAANSQFGTGFVSQGTLRLVDCFDATFNPIPNQ
jgi:hypothetical protein